MNKKVSIFNILFLLYIILLIILSGIIGVNSYIVILFLIISLLMYISKKVPFTLIGFIILSIFHLIYSILNNIDFNNLAEYERSVIGLQILPYYERSVIGLQILPYYVLGLIILVLLFLKDITNIMNNKNNKFIN